MLFLLEYKGYFRVGKKIQNVTSKEATLVSCLRMTKPYRVGTFQKSLKAFILTLKLNLFCGKGRMEVKRQKWIK